MVESEISILIGKTVESVAVAGNKKEVDITCVGGDCFKMYHMQDCCESVDVHDVVGDLAKLVGSPILFASEDVSSVQTPPDLVGKVDLYESYTWTIYTLTTSAGTVQIRWLGESNGYYSESVYFQRTHAPL